MSVKGLLRLVCAAVLVVLALVPQSVAQYRGGGSQPRRGGPGTGNPEEHRASWRFLQGDVLLHDHPVTLYWIPASLEQVEPSRLMTSDVLRVATTRCVDLEIVLPERAALVQKLGAEGKIPTAVLVDRKGEVIRRSENVRGVLSTEAVERMLSEELSARDEAMYRQMRQGSQQAAAGNKAAAIEQYQKIWDDRCLFPLAGTAAQQELAKLGVIVNEPPPVSAADPQLKTPAKTETGHR
jgi:hypothetical protein